MVTTHWVKDAKTRKNVTITGNRKEISHDDSENEERVILHINTYRGSVDVVQNENNTTENVYSSKDSNEELFNYVLESDSGIQPDNIVSEQTVDDNNIISTNTNFICQDVVITQNSRISLEQLEPILASHYQSINNNSQSNDTSNIQSTQTSHSSNISQHDLLLLAGNILFTEPIFNTHEIPTRFNEINNLMKCQIQQQTMKILIHCLIYLMLYLK